MDKAELYTNLPHYNFAVAIEEFGLDFDDLKKEGFEQFIRDIVIKDLTDLRRHYILRDFPKIRLIVHKFKGCFA